MDLLGCPRLPGDCCHGVGAHAHQVLPERLGAVWAEIKLPPIKKAIAFWTALYGAYANWTITTLAAIFGASSLSPITGSGHNAQPWQEGIVKFGFPTVGIAIIVSSLLILWGLRSKATS